MDEKIVPTVFFDLLQYINGGVSIILKYGIAPVLQGESYFAETAFP